MYVNCVRLWEEITENGAGFPARQSAPVLFVPIAHGRYTRGCAVIPVRGIRQYAQIGKPVEKSVRGFFDAQALIMKICRRSGMWAARFYDPPPSSRSAAAVPQRDGF